VPWENERGVSVVVGELLVINDISESPRAEMVRDCEWIAAYVSVSGLVNMVIDAGTQEYMQKATRVLSRRGRTNSGSRTRSESRVERQMDPKIFVVA